jgi:hypothetical protein
MRQRHLGSDVERLALITLMLAESRAVGPLSASVGLATHHPDLLC